MMRLRACWVTQAPPGWAVTPAKPAQQRRRSDKECGPAGAGKHSARGREQAPVSVEQFAPSDLAAQDRQLVAQYHDLELLIALRTEPQHYELQHTARDDIQA